MQKAVNSNAKERLLQRCWRSFALPLAVFCSAINGILHSKRLFLAPSTAAIRAVNGHRARRVSQFYEMRMLNARHANVKHSKRKGMRAAACSGMAYR